MQMQRIRLSEVFDSLPFIGRELEGISSDALLDPLVEFFFPILDQNICFNVVLSC